MISNIFLLIGLGIATASIILCTVGLVRDNDHLCRIALFSIPLAILFLVIGLVVYPRLNIVSIAGILLLSISGILILVGILRDSDVFLLGTMSGLVSLVLIAPIFGSATASASASEGLGTTPSIVVQATVSSPQSR